MPISQTPQDAKIIAATRVFLETLGEAFPLGVPIRLWDGSEIILGGEKKHATLLIHIRDPGLFPSLARSPRIKTFMSGYASGAIDITGGTLLDLAALRPAEKPKAILKRIGLMRLAKVVLPIVFGPGMSGRAGFDGQGRPLERATTKENAA